MKPNQVIIPAIAVTVALGVGIFVGVKYQQTKIPSFERISQQPRNGQGGQFALMGKDEPSQSGNGAISGFRPVSGKIISKDNTSITVETEDGSSKIIILADNTNINKAENGSIEDLTEDSNVVVFGQENPDGSVTAQNIQLGTPVRNFTF